MPTCKHEYQIQAREENKINEKHGMNDIQENEKERDEIQEIIKPICDDVTPLSDTNSEENQGMKLKTNKIKRFTLWRRVIFVLIAHDPLTILSNISKKN